MVKVALCLQFGVMVDTEEVVWIVGTCFVDIFDSIWLFLLILSVTNAISNLLKTTKHARLKPIRVFVNEENHVVPFLTSKVGRNTHSLPAFSFFELDSNSLSAA